MPVVEVKQVQFEPERPRLIQARTLFLFQFSGTNLFFLKSGNFIYSCVKKNHKNNWLKELYKLNITPFQATLMLF